MEIVFATHNPNKLIELQQIVPKYIKLLSLEDIGCHEDIIEDGKTIEENALIKANYVFQNYNMTCFGDDTGLCVEALNGAPGVFSARYAGSQKNAQDNMDKLLKELNEVYNRKAHFKTVIAYKSDRDEKCFTGICEGEILQKPKGKRGFGYDPIFKPNNFQQSFAEMPSDTKNKISHRGLATQELINFLENL
jgi:XTP/dITP diphosphohydrolase